MSDNDELGSLAQSSRGSTLKSVRLTLFIIGGLTLALNGFLFSNAEKEVADAQIAPQDVEYVLGLVRLIYGAGAAVGLAFVLCAIFLEKFPVPLTILSFVLYVGATAGFAYLDPSTLLQGLIIKVIIVVTLAKGVQTALAYERDRNASQESF